MLHVRPGEGKNSMHGELNIATCETEDPENRYEHELYVVHGRPEEGTGTKMNLAGMNYNSLKGGASGWVRRRGGKRGRKKISLCKIYFLTLFLARKTPLSLAGASFRTLRGSHHWESSFSFFIVQ